MSTTRFTIDLDQRADTVLTRLASDKGVTKAQIIRNALASYGFLQEQISPAATGKSGNKISITNAQDEVLKDIALP